MRLTFIVTIDPVKDLSLLVLLVRSLNLQTRQSFNVVFYNQTPEDGAALLSRLGLVPIFEHRVVDIDRRNFLGRYPIWDLYEVHHTLLEENALNEYFMALHMEEFPDADYVEQVIPVLEESGLDILFGNMVRTRLNALTLQPVLAARTAPDFTEAIRQSGAHHSRHWSFSGSPFRVPRSVSALRRRITELRGFGLGQRLRPTRAGCTAMPSYFAEDVYWMSREFARRHNWFLKGHHLYFEDIHICEQEGVCELGAELRRRTPFPVYFNRRRIYHVPHRRHYFQLDDEEFTSGLLAYPSTDPVIQAHQTAIARYRSGQFTLEQALRYTRQNAEGTGTQNLNYRYHMLYLDRPAGP